MSMGRHKKRAGCSPVKALLSPDIRSLCLAEKTLLTPSHRCPLLAV